MVLEDINVRNGPGVFWMVIVETMFTGCVLRALSFRAWSIFIGGMGPEDCGWSVGDNVHRCMRCRAESFWMELGFAG